jgi:hypothetical protein
MVLECVDVMLVEDDPRVRTMWSCQVEFLVFWSLSCKKSLRQVYLASGGPALASSTFCLRFLQVVRPSCLGLAAVPTPHTWGWTLTVLLRQGYTMKSPLGYSFSSRSDDVTNNRLQRGGTSHTASNRCFKITIICLHYTETLWASKFAKDRMESKIRKSSTVMSM